MEKKYFFLNNTEAKPPERSQAGRYHNTGVWFHKKEVERVTEVREAGSRRGGLGTSEAALALGTCAFGSGETGLEVPAQYETFTAYSWLWSVQRRTSKSMGT